jgi:ATP-binding cassette, subfamily B, multidrug efflux pump
MLRLLKYLKPYLPLILIAIGLLFVQANSDLALPDYMSRIVNNGIQQGGITSAVPSAIRQSEMNKLLVFLNSDEKTLVLSDYFLVDQGSVGYPLHVKQYPALSSEPIYLLKTVSKSEIDRLSPTMTKGLVILSIIQQAIADPSKAAAMGQGLGFDLTKLPPGTDLFSLIGKLPESQIIAMSSSINEKFNALGTNLTNQMATSAVKAEYIALGVDTTDLQTNYILKTGISMLLLTLLSVLCTIVVSLLSSRTAAGLARDLRRNVFQKVQGFSNAEFDKFSTASLITRSTNDITQIQMVVMIMMRMIIYAPIIGIGGVIRAIGKSSSMWWLIALAVIVVIGLISIVFSISLPKFKSIQKLIDRLNLVTRESLSGMMVIRAFNKQPFEEKRFDKANQDLTQTSLFVNRIMVVMMPVMMFIMNVLSVMIIWVGSHQVAEATMQVGDMMAFMQYAMQILFAFLMMSFMFILLPRASVSADRIADVLETRQEILDPKQPKQFSQPFNATIEFRDVCFRYPDAEEYMLQDISFTAKQGETTAFIGTTGSGKSTIVSLIPRFYDVTEGAILVDGIDIREVSQHDLREKIGYVPQKSNLFSGTIESNLLYADENASKEALKTATDIAQASEFIFAKPEGLEAEIAQGGMNVSGGQRQRLAIARALVKKAPIYIFDDSFSALDFKTDSALRKALKDHIGTSTLLIVTQRIATIKNSEQIIVLDEGKVVGKGTHNQLMKDCEVYRSIALSQLSQEELA